MTADEITRIIQLILAPVVMVTACAITLSGLFGHTQAVNDRLRLLARERLDLLHQSTDDALWHERLTEIDYQMPLLLRRHQLLRNALLTIETGVAVFVASMLAIAGAATSGSSMIAQLVLGLFLLGTLLLLAGVVMSALEIRVSHGAVDWEVRRVMSLKP